MLTTFYIFIFFGSAIYENNRFHPSSSKVLACATDVSGSLGFWDVNNIKKEEDDEDEEPVVYTYRPHTRGITNMLFDPTNSDKLYTSSYDGTLRYFDMKHASFGLVDFGGERVPFTNFDVSQDGHNVRRSEVGNVEKIKSKMVVKRKGRRKEK